MSVRPAATMVGTSVSDACLRATLSRNCSRTRSSRLIRISRGFRCVLLPSAMVYLSSASSVDSPARSSSKTMGPGWVAPSSMGKGLPLRN